MMNWKIYHLCKMNHEYTVYDDNENTMYDSRYQWCMLCASMLTPIIIMVIIYLILN